MPRVGELVQSTEGGWYAWPPARCGNGHQLGAGRMIVGNQPCSTGGHITWRCNQCGDTTYAPPLGSACRVLHGPAAVRISTTSDHRGLSGSPMPG
jgi:hypothetical protein